MPVEPRDRVSSCAARAGAGAVGRGQGSVASRDNRTALLASRQGDRLRGRHHAVDPPAVQPRKPRRVHHAARVGLVACPQLTAGIGVERPVGAAHGPAAACLTRHGTMPRWPLHALAVAISRPHARHRRPLHDDRTLGSRIPDRGDRRNGGGDRGGDDKTDGGHLIHSCWAWGGVRLPTELRSPLPESSTLGASEDQQACRPFRLKRSG